MTVDIDPILASVIQRRLKSITEEMGLTLLRTTVIDDGDLVGMLSLRDVQSAWLDALDRECESLRGAEAA